MATATLIPSGYTGLTGMTINSSYPIGNGYANSSSTNYTRFDISTNTIGYVYFTFDVSSIPSTATISSVTAQFKARVSNTTRVTNTGAQLYSGTSAKGSSTAFANTTASVRSITAGTWTRSELSNLRLYVTGQGSSSTSSKRIDFYGADITVTYTTETIHPTSVTISPSTVTIEAGETEQLTETVLPADATNKSVTWSSSNTSVATVSSTGLVTGISTGNATITVTTVDGSKTATSAITVEPTVFVDYIPATTLEAGNEYLIANGNTGSVYIVSNEASATSTLRGIATTVSNNKITISSGVAAKCTFTCELETVDDPTSTLLKNGTQYFYSDGSNGLRMFTWTSSAVGKHWHYKADGKNLLWFFNDVSGGSDGYNDSTTLNKYYLEYDSSGNFTGPYIRTPSLAQTTTPPIYIFVKNDAPIVHPTGVSVSPSTASIEVGETVQLTETVLPADTTDKSVSWSSNNTSVATVSNTGLVTGVSVGNATITVTTNDGGETATCLITCTPETTYSYKLATSLVVGKKYLISNGNNGSVRILTNEAGDSRQLVGAAATVSNNKISINAATKAKAEFECVRYTSGNDITTTLRSDGKYLFSNSSNGLVMNNPATLDRFWHYSSNGNKLWLFKSTTTDGWTDTSTEYKYYLEMSGNNFTDNHVTSPSIADTTLPAMYIFVEDDGSEEPKLYLKNNGSWSQYSKVYKKVNGSWIEQTNSTWDTIFDTNVTYRLMN